MSALSTTRAIVGELIRLQASGATGVLQVDADGVLTVLSLKAGRVVFAEEGTLGDSLGRLLVQTGKLTEEGYARVITRMASVVFDSEQLRLGEVVVEMGLLTPMQVSDALGNQVRRKLVRCISAERVQTRFEAGPLPRGMASFPTAVEPCVLAAARERFERKRVWDVLEDDAARYPRVGGDPTTVAERFALPGPELRFLLRLDGTLSLLSILASGAVQGVEGETLVAALSLCGDVTFSDHPRQVTPPPSIEVRVTAQGTTPPPMAILETRTTRTPPARTISRTSSVPPEVAPPSRTGPVRISTSPIAGATPVPPPSGPSVTAPSFAPPVRPSHIAPASGGSFTPPPSRPQAITTQRPSQAAPLSWPPSTDPPPSRTGAARVQPSPLPTSATVPGMRAMRPSTTGPRVVIPPPPSSAPSSAPLSARAPDMPPASSPESRTLRMEAEEAFRRGRLALRAGNPSKAQADLRRAAEFYPEALEYVVYARWVELLEGSFGGDDVTKRRKQLRRFATAAVKEERTFGFGYYVLGQLAMVDGDDETAERAFKAATRLDPDHVDAQRCLLIVARRRTVAKR